MAISNRAIVKDAINTGSLQNAGLLSPYQSKKFLKQSFEQQNLMKLVRHEMRTERTGEIDKIGIAKRILRGKTEGVDDGYRAGVNTSAIEYACMPVRLPWEITEETLRENIEGESLEKTITDLMTAQVGADTEDLALNGDEDTPSSDPDYKFLKLNDGWIKQIMNGAHVEDRSSKNSGAMSISVYYDMLEQIPNKYNNGNLRWIMSPRRKQEWEKYLFEQMIQHGGIVSEGVFQNPASIPTISCSSLANDKILLCDPKNLVVCNSYSMKIRKTTEGKTAVMEDKRFYVVHFDADFIIEESDACGIITGLK